MGPHDDELPTLPGETVVPVLPLHPDELPLLDLPHPDESGPQPLALPDDDPLPSGPRHTHVRARPAEAPRARDARLRIVRPSR